MQRRSLVLSTLLSPLALLTAGCGGGTDTTPTVTAAAVSSVTASASTKAAVSASVALGGNAFVTSAAPDATETITDDGLVNWTSSGTVTSIWFRMGAAGSATLAIDARLAGSKSSKIRVTANGERFDLTLSGARLRTYRIGTIQVSAPGYVRVDLQGISKNGTDFGEVSALRVSTDVALNYAYDPAAFGWSRHGPSVHLWYPVPKNTEYFYNEVTVPVGQDRIGSYFEANGFTGGYFGIQVNSPSERRILFSVWDADNGARTTMVGKGPGVIDNRFGGEGTGGQTYLVYPWTAGQTYRFITRARPDGAGATDFSAWFYVPETGTWRYIATWKQPATTTYLTGVYSFVENFINENGYLERRARFGNQWARSASGTWTEITSARFTGDSTAVSGQRMDYAGGVEYGQFYLRNGGFFNDYVPLDQVFTRPTVGTPPKVDLKALPQ
jgi:hypothetical protein